MLDKACSYTICDNPIIERKVYGTTTKGVTETLFAFNPVPEKNARAYHISDAHGQVDEPVLAAKTFGNIDFLIFNGDIFDDDKETDEFYKLYDIISRITGGTIPPYTPGEIMIFARNIRKNLPNTLRPITETAITHSISAVSGA